MRAITIIVPFAAGGPTDIVAHLIASHMSRALGLPVRVENVVGAGGTTAAVRAKRATPDGHTIILGHLGTHAASVASYPNPGYHPITDFEPVGMVAGMPVAVLARKDFPADNLQEFAARLREKPARMAHAGLGSVAYTTCLLFNNLAGSTPEVTRFNGTGPAMDALVAGEIDYMCDQIVSVVPKARAGAIKVYAVGTPERNPALPDVPTAAEAGMPEFQALSWNGLFVPKGTPPAVIARLNAILGEALDDEGTRKQLTSLGASIPKGQARTPEALAQLVESEIIRWSAIIKAAAP